MSADGKKLSTRLVHAARSADAFDGAVNPPIQRASTLLTDDIDKLYSGTKSLYGRMGLKSHQVLSDAMSELEGASYTQLASCGLNACALALAAAVEAGDHLIASDSVYGPTRRFCERRLKAMGVGASFFNARDLEQLKSLIRPNTKAIFLEGPGSLTFELHDVEPIVELARQENIFTIFDNTWSAGVFFKPLDWGLTASVQALTKYVIGHSDGFGGAVMTNDRTFERRLFETASDWGISMSPDDVYLAQRGLRSLELRIREQGQKGIDLAHWLEEHPAVETVHHPALASHPDHEIWTRYYSGASGLFGFTLKPTEKPALKRFFDSLELFGFGFSWGGFESLMIPCDPQLKRSESPEWKSRDRGALIRVSVGLESIDDLKADLRQAFDRMAS